VAAGAGAAAGGWWPRWCWVAARYRQLCTSMLEQCQQHPQRTAPRSTCSQLTAHPHAHPLHLHAPCTPAPSPPLAALAAPLNTPSSPATSDIRHVCVPLLQSQVQALEAAAAEASDVIRRLKRENLGLAQQLEQVGGPEVVGGDREVRRSWQIEELERLEAQVGGWPVCGV
jgi:hypothetical protein